MADGNLNFDTKIDQSGFIKGIKSIGKGVTGFAADIKSLVDRAVSSFKQIAAAYQVQIEAEARLGATMRNSTSASKEEIQSVKDLAGSLQELGVVGDEVQLAGAQELATYVKSADSIKTMLPVLDDMIAQQYGFSASTDNAVTIATMLGKVLQGQTSALSRYGYSFDENQERLLKYGTEEQRVATLAAVVEESVSGVNKALADTPTGKVKQLSNDFGDLKETVGKMLTDVLYPVVTVFDTIVKKINAVFSSISDRIREVMGITDSTDINLGQSFEDVEEVTEEAAQNTADMADSSQEAEKANKGSLAAFDELNVLAQENSKPTVTNTENAVEDVLPDGIDTSFTLDVDANTDEAESKLTSLMDRIKKSLEDFFAPLKAAWDKHGKHIISSVKDWAKNLDFEPLKKSFDRLKKSVDPIIDKIGARLSWFFDEILLPLGKWTIEEGVPAFFDALSGVISLIDAVGGTVENTLKLIWDNFLSKVVSFAGDAITGFLKALGQFLKDIADNQNAVTALVVIAEVIGTIAAAIALIKAVPGIISTISTALGVLGNPITWIIIAIAAIIVVIIEVITYWDTLKEAWLDGVQYIKQSIKNFIDKWKSGVEDIKNSALNLWNNLKDGAKKAWEGVKNVFGKVADFFGRVFSNAWNKVKEVFNKGGAIFVGIKDGIINVFTSVVNSLIDAINNVIRAPFEGINNALDGIRGVVILDWKPFEWLPSISIPQIPRLATGTVVPANYGEFAAILGDNKREPEVVSPISAIEQAVENVLNRRGITSSSDGDIVVEIDGREVFRATKKQADHYKRMHGRPAFG